MKILQIGCNNGDDHVYQYIKNNISNIEKVYLLDANEECIKASKLHYKNIQNIEFLTYAITTNEEQEYVDLLIPNNGDITHAHASISAEYLNHHNDILKIKVKTKTINQIFEDLNLTVLDRLYVDAESLDIDIINSINFSKIKIKFLMFECYHSDGRDSNGGPKLDEVLNKLNTLGYSTRREELNIVAIKHD